MSYIPDDPNDPFNQFTKATLGVDLSPGLDWTDCPPSIYHITWVGDNPIPVPVTTITLKFPSTNPSEVNTELTRTILAGVIDALDQSSTHGTYHFSTMNIRVEADTTGYAPSSVRFSAIDDDTYDGAPDSRSRHQVGHGATPAEAIADLIDILSA